ncbi:MAG: hypothetical protein LQ337_000828 [Flavoplaca oasis]|nr:MAG: hypothetical protein LQ337_000828 [Flavoplaca oasis]
MLRHEKPYKCDVLNCQKNDGFSTNNDLDRHKKSVHKIMPTNSNDRSFRCAALNCPKREKIWPRLDNFRQHCKRIHPEVQDSSEKLDELKNRDFSCLVANHNPRKHQKRHTRPYGCTFPGCWKKLGSKNDWKRHENTQHYQIETWRCHEDSKSSPIGQCASIFYRREQFQGHLREKHHIKDDQYIQTQCKRHRIGRNGQGKFWCGFCREIVELKTKGLDAWEERFRHIDDQHYKQGQTIYDWVPLDGHVSKGVMGKGDYMESGSKDDDNNVDDGEDDESSNDDDDSRRPQDKSLSGTPSGLRADSDFGRSRDSSNGKTRAKRREKIWHCVSNVASWQ